VVLLIDGDTQIPVDIVERAAPFFAGGKVGALTTDEAADIQDTPIFRDWFKLRFTQRQMMMSAVALSRRVLTLTGRMSVFRADLATRPEFIAAIEEDYIEHWRLGRVKFLTGDDKSTWFWLLRHGYEMA
jgi:glycosyltransferase Alg8